MNAPVPNESGAQWLRSDGAEGDVVMSSRVRLARNLAGFPFPNAADNEERQDVLDLVTRAAAGAELAPNLVTLELARLPDVDRYALVERHLISKQLAHGDAPRAVILSSPDEWLSVMINEEDHLRIQAIHAGLDVRAAHTAADAVDDKLESRIDYAYSNELGYLTACPTNVGAGIRVSVMLHLPALRLTGDIDKVRRAVKDMKHTVRGFYGEGSDVVGDFYQISNHTTLGKTEGEIVDFMETQLAPTIIGYERKAREKMLNARRTHLEDKVHRAFGALLHARLLTSDEALEKLSLVRFGVLCGVLKGPDPRVVNDLILLTQPAHLQRVSGRTMEQGERTVARASLVRQRLGAAT